MRKLLIILVALLVPAGLAYAGLKLGGETLREKSVEINTSSTFGSGVPCPNGSNTQVMYVDSVTGCDADEGFTFTEGTNLVNINEATDGDSILLRLDNDQANASGSTNETAQLRFGFGTDIDVARISVIKASDFTSAPNSDSILKFDIDQNGTSTEILRLRGTGSSNRGVDINNTNQSAALNVDGFGGDLLEIRNSGSPRLNAILINNNLQTIFGGRSSGIGLAVFGPYGTSSPLGLFGDSTHDQPATLSFGWTSNGIATNTGAFIDWTQDTTGGRPNSKPARLEFRFDDDAVNDGAPLQYRFVGFTRTGLGQEDTFFQVGDPTSGETRNIGSGVTITDFRHIQFKSPTINGVAGGATETVTNAASVYINAAPSGSNITFTNGPYALWVDAGAVRFDGAVTYNSTQTATGDITIQKADPSLIYDVTTATDTDFWAGVQDDAGSDDDDLYQIGDGTTPGSNVALTINTSLQTGLGDTTPTATLTVGGHIHTSGTAPTISACGAGTPSIVGNDNAGKVTIGTGVVTSCTLTFASSWTNAPACFANNETQILLTRATSTTTTVILDAAVTFDADVISYHCMGRE